MINDMPETLINRGSQWLSMAVQFSQHSKLGICLFSGSKRQGKGLIWHLRENSLQQGNIHQAIIPPELLNSSVGASDDLLSAATVPAVRASGLKPAGSLDSLKNLSCWALGMGQTGAIVAEAALVCESWAELHAWSQGVCWARQQGWQCGEHHVQLQGWWGKLWAQLQGWPWDECWAQLKGQHCGECQAWFQG